MLNADSTERWLPVVGHEGRYWVSDLGRVRSRYRVLSGSNDNGYRRVCLSCVDGHEFRLSVHCLVMRAFIGPPPEGKEVNHINFDRSDNRLINLEYITHAENNIKSAIAGRKSIKLSQEHVIEIRRRLSEGQFHSLIASDFGVTPSMIAGIASGRRGKFTGLPCQDLRRKSYREMSCHETDEMIRLRKDGMSVLSLASRFNVGKTTIYRKLSDGP